MQVFDLNSNYFTGTIPSSFRNVTTLEFISLYDNEFIGQFPVSLLRNSNMHDIFVDQNYLTGQIHDFDNYINLYVLVLSGETNILL